MNGSRISDIWRDRDGHKTKLIGRPSCLKERERKGDGNGKSRCEQLPRCSRLQLKSFLWAFNNKHETEDGPGGRGAGRIKNVIYTHISTCFGFFFHAF